jgi:hypothetical protein
MLDHKIIIFYPNLQAYHTKSPNLAVQEVLGNLNPPIWYSSTIVMSQYTSSTGQLSYRNVSAADFRVVVDYLHTFQIPYQIDLYHPSLGIKVEGVKINCLAGVQDDPHKFEPVCVPLDHPVFTMKQGPIIPTILGIELYVRRYNPELGLDGVLNLVDYINDDARLLHMNVDPLVQQWALPAETAWLGNVVVIRVDRKPIAPRQVEVLCAYCRDVVQGDFIGAVDVGQAYWIREGNRRGSGQLLTRERFERHFEKYKREHARVDFSWADEKGLYDET